MQSGEKSALAFRKSDVERQNTEQRRNCDDKGSSSYLHIVVYPSWSGFEGHRGHEVERNTSGREVGDTKGAHISAPKRRTTSLTSDGSSITESGGAINA